MSKGIKLSPQHGLNPTITVCFYCGEDKNELVLLGIQGDKIARSIPGCHDGQMPMHCCLNMEPCDNCKAYMKQGIIIIGTVDHPKDMDNPERNGMFLVVKDEAIENLIGHNKELYDHVMKARFVFMEEKTLKATGLADLAKQMEGSDGK